jgi:peroxiredoxin
MNGPFDPYSLPAGLPVPFDDGAAAHLPGLAMPDLTLPTTAGGEVPLSRLGVLTVLFVYPMTGRPGVLLPEGWDSIPGARGCTAEACGFRDSLSEFHAFGAIVYGMSSQSTEEQQEAVSRLQLPYPLLSDERLQMAAALHLPTFAVEGRRYFSRLTLVVERGRIAQVFYPIFPPDRHAEEVLWWLRQAGPIGQP